MYTALNQYHVVMVVGREFWQNPLFLRQLYAFAPNGQDVPLSAFSQFNSITAPLAVNHQGLSPSVMISFNLQPGVALGDAADAILQKATQIGLPSTIHTGFSGTAQAYQDSLSSEPLLIAAALVSVYLVLGILYESYVHPVTILSTLPSAGVGALLALLLTRTELTVIAIIGIILLIGIVKKNAILMIDFALAAERGEGKSSRDCDLRSMFVAFPPHPDDHHGGHARRRAARPRHRHRVGIPPSAGNRHHRRLAVSQLLTLYTTPVVYLYFDRVQHWWWRRIGIRRHEEAGTMGSEA